MLELWIMREGKKNHERLSLSHSLLTMQLGKVKPLADVAAVPGLGHVVRKNAGFPGPP